MGQSIEDSLTRHQQTSLLTCLTMKIVIVLCFVSIGMALAAPQITGSTFDESTVVGRDGNINAPGSNPTTFEAGSNPTTYDISRGQGYAVQIGSSGKVEVGEIEVETRKSCESALPSCGRD